MYKKILGSAIGVGVIAVGVFFAWNYFHPSTNEYLPIDHVVTIGSKQIQVRIADTETKQVQGLSGFKVLPPDQGMLFLFTKADSYSFWMKDMRFPLDVVWLTRLSNNTYRVVGVVLNVGPETYPHAFTSPEPADAFLELPAHTITDTVVGSDLVLNKK